MTSVSVAHNLQEKPRTGDVLISENVNFEGLLLSESILKGLKSAGFERPSPIQLKAIPLGRCGLDLIVQAKSGTGKTCVFSVIALESLQLDTSALQVLVLAPTREIAIQIWDVIKSIGQALPQLSCHTFIGGMPFHEDKQKLKKCHIAVGTPGRIKQLIEQEIMNIENIRMFILDEADKLLEDSFQEQINWIYSTLPDNKQMLALSATYPEYLANHLTAYMRNPTFLRLNVSDPALLGIRQYYRSVKFHPLPNKLFESKVEVVTTILSSVEFQQCLVFSNLQTMAQNMADALNSKGWPTTCIAGSLDQKDRNLAMSKLKTFQCRVLISTDLTSRGIDADKVNLVINLDVPKDHETYLHRIGRAGRFGTFGACVTVASEGQEILNLQSIEKKCSTSITKLPDPIPSDLVKTQGTINLDDMVSTEKIFTLKENGHTVDSLTSQNDETKHLSRKNFESIKIKNDQLNVTIASELKNSITNDVKGANDKPIVLNRLLNLGNDKEKTDSSEKSKEQTDSYEKSKEDINGVEKLSFDAGSMQNISNEKRGLGRNLNKNHQNGLIVDKPVCIEDNSAALQKLKINDAGQTKEVKSKPKKHATANFWTQLILERNDDKEFVQEFQDSQREEDIFDISLQIAKDLQFSAKKSEKFRDSDSGPQQRRKTARRRNEQKQNTELVSDEIPKTVPISEQKSSEIKLKIPSLTETVGFKRLENTHTYKSAVNSCQTFSEKTILSEVDANVAIYLGKALGYDQDLFKKIKEVLAFVPLQTQVKADLKIQNLNASLHCPTDNVQIESGRQTIKAIRNRQKPSAINRKSNLSVEKQLKIDIPPNHYVEKQTISSTQPLNHSYLVENGGEFNLNQREDKEVKSIHGSVNQRQNNDHILKKTERKKAPFIKDMSCCYDIESKSSSKSDTLVSGETSTNLDDQDARNHRQSNHYTKYSENENYIDPKFEYPKQRNGRKTQTCNFRKGDFSDGSESEESDNKCQGNPWHFNWKDYHKAFTHNQFSYPYSYLHNPYMYMQPYPYMNCCNPYLWYNPCWNVCSMPYQQLGLPYESLYKNLEMQQKYIKMMLKSYKKMIQKE